jgi:aspartyl-tRNA(Asn)/glutamyl-tRNA(Gln) amidotransferase subunit A
MIPSVTELRSSILARKISAVEVARQALAQIEKIDTGEKGLGSFITIEREKALAAAAEVDCKVAAGQPVGVLAGVPVAVKDNICVLGGRTTAASKILHNFISPYDATVVQRLKAADAVIVGKTNLDEFAMGSSTETSALAKTKNPWDPTRVPGGSSGGSAVAVASRMAPVSLGSDTGGSIRHPASLCGVTGLKPTYGRVSRYGLLAYGSSLDQIGPFGVSAEDCAALLQAIAGYDSLDSTSVDQPVPDYLAELKKIADQGPRLSGMRIGVLEEFAREGVSPDVIAATDGAVKEMEKLGAVLVSVKLPNIGYAIATYYIIATAEASSNLARYDGVHYGHRTALSTPPGENSTVFLYSQSRSEGFGHEVKKRIMLGTYVLSSGYYDAYYLRALKVRRLIKNDFDAAFQQCDAIALPVSPMTAWKFGELSADPLAMYLADIFTISANLAGIPGISLPCGFDRTPTPGGAGLPIGLQLLGPVFSESRLLGITHAFQQVTDWHKRVPQS